MTRQTLARSTAPGPVGDSALIRARYLGTLPRDAEGHHRLWSTPEGRIIGRFMACNLSSVFQPVVRLDNGAPFGHEAFVRSFDADGSDLSPWNLFAHAASDESLVELDRLCRTLHVLNAGHIASAGPLFLNVHDRLMLAVGDDHGSAFGRVLSALRVPRRDIVIESPPAMADDLSMLTYVMLNYRYNGYRIAVNLPDAALIDPLFRHLRPDFIKFDGSRDPLARELPAWADKCARTGVKRIVTRIEHPALLEQARRAGAPFGQGHALGRPTPAIQAAA
jgi:EAL domain-containing protein (putative c-di-GMP-specific phosphodiesterase class I)